MTSSPYLKLFSLSWSLVLIAGILINFQYAGAQNTTRPPIVPDQGSDSTISTLLIPHADPNQTIPDEQYFGGVLLPGITKTVIAAAAGLAFLFIIIGGIQILTAYGEEEKITGAKKTITYAIVGLLVAMLSYAIVTIISNIKL